MRKVNSDPSTNSRLELATSIRLLYLIRCNELDPLQTYLSTLQINASLDDKGNTVLHLIAQTPILFQNDHLRSFIECNYEEVQGVILTHNFEGKNALDLAIITGNYTAFIWLWQFLDAPDLANRFDNDHNTLLHLMAFTPLLDNQYLREAIEDNENKPHIQQMLEKKNAHGFNPIDLAVKEFNITALRWLISLIDDQVVTNQLLLSALFKACFNYFLIDKPVISKMIKIIQQVFKEMLAHHFGLLVEDNINISDFLHQLISDANVEQVLIKIEKNSSFKKERQYANQVIKWLIELSFSWFYYYSSKSLSRVTIKKAFLSFCEQSTFYCKLTGFYYLQSNYSNIISIMANFEIGEINLYLKQSSSLVASDQQNRAATNVNQYSIGGKMLRLLYAQCCPQVDFQGVSLYLRKLNELKASVAPELMELVKQFWCQNLSYNLILRDSLSEVRRGIAYVLYLLGHSESPSDFDLMILKIFHLQLNLTSDRLFRWSNVVKQHGYAHFFRRFKRLWISHSCVQNHVGGLFSSGYIARHFGNESGVELFCQAIMRGVRSHSGTRKAFISNEMDTVLEQEVSNPFPLNPYIYGYRPGI